MWYVNTEEMIVVYDNTLGFILTMWYVNVIIVVDEIAFMLVLY